MEGITLAIDEPPLSTLSTSWIRSIALAMAWRTRTSLVTPSSARMPSSTADGLRVLATWIAGVALRVFSTVTGSLV